METIDKLLTINLFLIAIVYNWYWDMLVFWGKTVKQSHASRSIVEQFNSENRGINITWQSWYKLYITKGLGYIGI
jgi:hypothetical protein